MRLALQLGRTLDELGRTMSSYEFGLWWSVFCKEPWGDHADWIRAAMIQSTIASFAGKMWPQGKPPPKYTDFMPHESAPESSMPETDPVEFFNKLFNA